MMGPVSPTIESYCGMDELWQKVGAIANSDGSLKYPQLFALMKCVLSLSHGNAVPERYFSMKKIMLESHGYAIDNDAIAALRLVKDSIRKEGGMDKFPIRLFNYSFKSYAKYQEYLTSKRSEDERERNLKFQREAASAAAEARKQELEVRAASESCR